MLLLGMPTPFTTGECFPYPPPAPPPCAGSKRNAVILRYIQTKYSYCKYEREMNVTGTDIEIIIAVYSFYSLQLQTNDPFVTVVNIHDISMCNIKNVNI